jgi:hypothetical protein
MILRYGARAPASLLSSCSAQGLLRLLFSSTAAGCSVLCCFCCWFADERSLKQQSHYYIRQPARRGEQSRKKSIPTKLWSETKSRSLSRGPPLLDAMLTGVELFFERCWFITLCISRIGRRAVYVLARGYSACIMPHYKFSIFNLEKYSCFLVAWTRAHVMIYVLLVLNVSWTTDWLRAVASRISQQPLLCIISVFNWTRT